MKKQNIKNIIHTALKDKIAFGESKHNAKKELDGFGKSTYKIYSYSTYNTYLKANLEYAKWLQENKNINKINDLSVTEQYASEYIQYRLDSGVSVYTAKMERSALAMLYSKQIEIDMPKRDNKNITRSRKSTENDKHISRNGKYKDVFTVALATGGRRSDIQKLSINDFKEIDGNLYVTFIQSKGGRNRLAPVLEEYTQQVKDIMENVKLSGKTRLFEHIPKEIDVHSLRREYAKNLYKNITENKDLKDKYLFQYPERVEYKNNKEIKRNFYKDRDNNIYDRDNIYIVSQALGHNRLDVSVTHYLK
ncbi:MAG: tyrosine-type recombinase/integrase [Lachnospiraceae bacterium]|nr:tyrosine-type recombinase/integrase [Lachnospiraceae bacterium]